MATYMQRNEVRTTLITLMLREDHQKVNRLVNQFDNTMTAQEKRDNVTAALALLEVLITLKEELIYPAWREHVDEPDLVDEALNRHHAVHRLIKELKSMNPEDKQYGPKFAVLGEQVQHHIEEEEGKMFPLAEKADLNWEQLATDVIERRQSLEHQPLWVLGVPVIFERKTLGATRELYSHRSGDGREKFSHCG